MFCLRCVVFRGLRCGERCEGLGGTDVVDQQGTRQYGLNDTILFSIPGLATLYRVLE